MRVERECMVCGKKEGYTVDAYPDYWRALGPQPGVCASCVERSRSVRRVEPESSGVMSLLQALFHGDMRRVEIFRETDGWDCRAYYGACGHEDGVGETLAQAIMKCYERVFHGTA